MNTLICIHLNELSTGFCYKVVKQFYEAAKVLLPKRLQIS